MSSLSSSVLLGTEQKIGFMLLKPMAKANTAKISRNVVASISLDDILVSVPRFFGRAGAIISSIVPTVGNRYLYVESILIGTTIVSP